MTDDERLLEIATRFVDPRSTIAGFERAYQDAVAWLSWWRERTGAQGREQDVSDELLKRIHYWISCATGGLGFREILSEIESIQRARAAGKGEG